MDVIPHACRVWPEAADGLTDCPMQVSRCADELRTLRHVSLTIRAVAGSAFFRYTLRLALRFLCRTASRAVREGCNVALFQFLATAAVPFQTAWRGHNLFTLNSRRSPPEIVCA